MTPAPKDKEIMIPVSISRVIKTSIAEYLPPAIEKAMTEHIKNCPIGKIEKVVFGNGETGLKLQVHDNTQDIKSIKKTYFTAKNKAWQVLRPVLTWAIIAIITIFFVTYINNQAVQKTQAAQQTTAGDTK